MSILVDHRTRVIMQGMTGPLLAGCRDYGRGRKCFVGSVDSQGAGARHQGLPVFGSVQEARAETGATASVICVPTEGAAAAIEEAIAAGIELVVCLTQGMAPDDVARVRRRAEGSGTRLLGPGCAGAITPGEINVGVIAADGCQGGRVGIVSRSQALTRETVAQLRAFGLGQSTIVGLAGDAACGLTGVDVLEMFGADPGTDAVLIVGDTCGDADEACAQWAAVHPAKPVLGFFIGDAVAARPLAAMRECGMPVARNAAALGELLAGAVAPQWLPFD
jgi:succinyl-CoA synthetase alpha subunit